MVNYINRISDEFYQSIQNNAIRGYALTLELNDLEKSINSGAKFATADFNTSVIAIQLIFANEKLVLNENSVVYANISKGSKIVKNECTIVDYENGIITLQFKSESINTAGENQFEIIVQRTPQEKLASPKVIFTVYKSFDSENNEVADNEIPIVAQLSSDIMDIRNKLSNIGSSGLVGEKGEKGDKGDAFTYEDFTSEQLELLKGEKGDKGDIGEKGEMGNKGEKGDKGDKGDDGIINIDEIYNSLNTTNKTIISAINELLTRIIDLEKGQVITPPEEEDTTNTLVSILPKFTDTSWTYVDGATDIIKDNYDVSFVTPIAWDGVSLWGWNDVKEGDVITIGVNSTSSNVDIQIWANGTEILGFTEGTEKREKTITVPSSTSGYDFVIVSNTANATISISGLYVIKNNSNNVEEDVVETPSTSIPSDAKIGFKREVEEEVLETNNVIVSDVSSLKSAITNATPGQTIYVRKGDYITNLSIASSGSEGNYITIRNYPNEIPNIVGSVTFKTKAKYINFQGFLLRDLQGSWLECVKVSGGCSYINIRNCEITNITQDTTSSETNGCNPLVLYGDSTTPISNCIIENNYIHDCDTGWSEAITLNGNVTNCEVIENTIDNCKNIGIDLAGNFSWTGTVGDSNNQARFTTVARNLVMNCQSPYATSAGLYCDGGRDNIFENNIVYKCQAGIELGAEESGAVAENFYVRNNLIIDCGRSIGVGGYQSTSATHRNSYIYNNTIICKDGQDENYGLQLERTDNVEFYNNIIYGDTNTVLYENSNSSNTGIVRGNNLYYKLNGSKPSGESNSQFADPLFVNNTGDLTGDYNLQSSSPCINKGKSDTSTDKCGTQDLNGKERVSNSRVDIGAYEYQ